MASDELRKLAQEHSDLRLEELKQEEEKLRERAQSDLKGWEQTIKRHIERKRESYLSLDNIGDNWNNQNYQKAPYVETEGLMWMPVYRVEVYAKELELLLGKPFGVEVKDVRGEEDSWYRTFTISW